jgi:hypothetical protein
MEIVAKVEDVRGVQKRQEILTKIFKIFVDAGYSVLILRNRTSFFERPQKENISSKGSLYVYPVANDNCISKWVMYLQRIKLWHQPAFRILIGSKELPDKILNSSVKSINDIEKTFKDFIVGCIDPLDNDLDFYGMQIKDLVLNNFPDTEI